MRSAINGFQRSSGARALLLTPTEAALQITHWHAACQTIEAPGLRILCDPWFGYGDGQGGGNYDGSWAPSVPLPSLPEIIERIGPVDYIYVSHLHPDHYSPEFLRAYLTWYTGARLLVSDESMFQGALRRDGFDTSHSLGAGVCQLSPGVDPPGAVAWILRHPIDVIDSALVVTAGDYAVVHLNDCRYNEAHVAQIKTLVQGRRLVALLPYLGAGEYPQTYEMSSYDYAEKATKKRQAFKTMFCQYVDALNPTRAIPIAGESEYVGPLAALNPLRGLPDPREAALWRLQGQALYFGDTIDLVTDAMVVPAPREPWEPAPQPKFLGYRYERDFTGLDAARIEPLLRTLAGKAAHNLLARQTLPRPYWLAVGTPKHCYTALDLSGRWGVRPAMSWAEARKLGEPREEIEVDPRYLYGLLTGLYNWNTAAGGGHLHCRRAPLDAYCEPIFYELLPRLHV